MRNIRIPQYEARGYVEGMEKQAMELFSEAFGGRRFSPEMWSWQFLHNPCLTKRITTLWDGGRLIALNALNPSEAYLDGKKVLSAVSGTTMAKKEYMGVSLQLFRECRKQNQDVRFIYGFPNHNSYRLTVKYCGFHPVGEAAFWTRPPERRKPDPCIAELKQFTDSHAELAGALADGHSYINARTKGYLNWRFADKPGNNYRCFEYKTGQSVLGYIVLNEYEENGVKQLQVIDCIAPDVQVFSELIGFAVSEAAEQNDAVIKLWMTSETYAPVLERLGFVYGSHPFRLTLWTDDYRIEGMYFTMSDSDIF